MSAFEDLMKRKADAGPGGVPLLDPKNVQGASPEAQSGVDLVEGAKPADVKAAQRKVASVQKLVSKAAPEAAPAIVAQEAAKIEAKPSMSRGDKIAIGLIAVLPTLIGGLTQGAEGGAIGAKVSTDALGGIVADAKESQANATAASDKALTRQDKIDEQERELASRKEDRASRERIANRDRGSAARDASSARLSLAQERLDIKKQDKLDKDVLGLSDRMQKAGLGDAISRLSEIDAEIGGLDNPGVKDLPGYGIAGGALPDLAAGDDGRRLRQLVQGLANINLKDRSGAAVSDQEYLRFKKEFGTGTMMTEKQLLDGLRTYRNIVQRVAQGFEAGAAPEAVQEYSNRPGALTSAQVPRQAAGNEKPQTVTQGGHTYTLNKATGQYE